MQAEGEKVEAIEGVAITGRSRPETIEQMQECVRDHDQGQAIFPAGGMTSLDVGRPPSRPGVLLETTALNRVVDYPHEDMTITVETGIRMSDLSAVLREHHQELPIDVPDPDRATLGGLIATNSSGPRRFGHGTLRDYILGIDVVDAQGRRIHGGGRVVKNVAGYDLMKLHTGALGTLGIVVQVTLKLKPLPGARQAVLVELKTEQIERVLSELVHSQTRPVGLELVQSSVLAPIDELQCSTPWGLILFFEEAPPAVEWQVGQVTKEFQQLGITAVRELEAGLYDRLLSLLTHWPRHVNAAAVFKANQLPGRTASFCQLIAKQLPEAQCVAHAGNGIIWTAVSQGTTWVQIGHSPLRRFAEDGIGNVVIDRCPMEWKAEAPVWGAPRHDWEIMRKIKAKLDPHDLFNPGRFVV